MRADWFPERGALPSLLGSYIYAEIYEVFGGELPTVQLFAGGSSGDSGLGSSPPTWSSFGEDARAHIYGGDDRGAVCRLEPTSRLEAQGGPPGQRPRCKSIQATIVGTAATTFARAPRAEMSSSAWR